MAKKEVSTIPLIHSNNFTNYLNNITSMSRISGETSRIVSSMLSGLNNSYMENYSFIDITEDEDTISFIPSDKVIKLFKVANKSEDLNVKEFNKWLVTQESLYEVKAYIKGYVGIWNYGRVEMKIGKYAKKVLSDKGFTVSDSEIEQFVNKWKANYKSKSNPLFKVVSGDDISKWYDQVNYAHSHPDGGSKEGLGTLGKSCMRYSSYNYFDLYTKNSKCQLLLLLSKENNEKIIGRALLWQLDNGKTYMDRIYTHFDSDTYLFLKFAKENNYETHYHNMNRGVSEFIHYKTTLEKIDFVEYPYLDTFYYICLETKEASSDVPKSKTKKNYIFLRNTDGSASTV